MIPSPARYFYNFFWGPVRGLFLFFLHLRVESQEDLSKLKGPLIIVSTHGCWFDPWLIGSVFPFKAQVFPIRYACWHRFYYFPLFLPFVWSFGAFPIRKGEGPEKNLEFALNLLRQGAVVGIFPTGKRRRLGRPKKGRRGAAFLALETNSPILPVKIEGNLNISLADFFRRRRKVRVKIGKVFSLPPQETKRPEDLNQPANFIMERVREL